MDLMTVGGVVLAFVSLIVGSVLKGADLQGLLGGAAFMIVIVGTIAAIMVQTPGSTMKRALQIFVWLFRPPQHNPKAIIDQIVQWSRTARKDGLLGLEPVFEREKDPFMKKGLQMLVDGGEPETIRTVMEVELETSEDFDIHAAKVYEGMGIYAPTLGIVGAVLGLMSVMGNLADPSKLGPGIAAAFTATIYGIASANLFFLPMSNKLKYWVREEAKVREVLIEGLVAIAQGENPREIETRLQSYFVLMVGEQGRG